MTSDSKARKSYFFSGDGSSEFGRLAAQAQSYFEEEWAALRDIGLMPHHTLIDAGCGPGYVASQIASVLKEGKVYGYDVESKFVEMARQKCKGMPNVEFNQASIDKLPRADKSADVIYSRLVFSHLREPMLALKEFRRVLKPGGTAMVLDVDDGLLVSHPEVPELDDVIKQAMATQTSAGGDRFVGRKLGQMFVEAGFNDINVRCKMFIIADEGSVPLFDIYIDGRLDYVPELTRARFAEARGKIKARLESKKLWVYLPIFYVWGKV